MHKYLTKTIVFFVMMLFVLLCTIPAHAQPEREMTTLKMFYDEDDIVVTPTRYPKSISRVGENVTIVTADEIRAINAHTLTDVLMYLPGVQLSNQGSPGSFANVSIQGSQYRHVLLLIDGVPQNNLSDFFPDVGAVPVQNIQRIEIIKGPASSSWGSSLGGVINIITKSPDDSRAFGGTLSASIGERSSGDYRGEVSGKSGDLGYYLSGGGLLTDGLLPHNGFHGGNLYTKLRYAPTDRTDLTFTLGYSRGFRGMGAFPAYDLSGDTSNSTLFSTLSLNHSLTGELSLALAVHSLCQENELSQNQLGTGIPFDIRTGSERSFGGSAKLLWTQKRHDMAFGMDFDAGQLKANFLKDGKQHLDRWGVFLNDTLTLGKFSFTPGLRYDHTSVNGDFWSPSLGITFSPLESTVLRAYVARGFNIPPLSITFGDGFFSVANPDLRMERVWSYSLGLETTLFRYFWLKTTIFRHDISDLQDSVPLGNDVFTYGNYGRQRRQGVEAEVKTMPLFNTSLAAGYALIDATDRLSGAEVPDTPRYTWDVGLQYDDRKSFRATLKGHFIRWNGSTPVATSSSTMIWDLFLAKRFPLSDRREMEVFFSGRNLFNGSQYLIDLYRNPGRWFEGGLRFTF
jgi:vitamin B12 transporter